MANFFEFRHFCLFYVEILALYGANGKISY